MWPGGLGCVGSWLLCFMSHVVGVVVGLCVAEPDVVVVCGGGRFLEGFNTHKRDFYVNIFVSFSLGTKPLVCLCC